jgi:hypothetical protein
MIIVKIDMTLHQRLRSWGIVNTLYLVWIDECLLQVPLHIKPTVETRDATACTA